ncbi:hypothetical protein O3P69_013101 [Scylla paramamosain]|uniref:Uncharacterized protein n=1 Tax=Scylla paramamosain TaxID=85552 RepID=A0AAW0TYH6_SCYPA
MAGEGWGGAGGVDKPVKEGWTCSLPDPHPVATNNTVGEGPRGCLIVASSTTTTTKPKIQDSLPHFPNSLIALNSCWCRACGGNGCSADTREISLLKTQLKDSQGDQTTRGHELLHLRAQVRQYQTEVERRRAEINSLHDLMAQQRRESDDLRLQLDTAQQQHSQARAHDQDLSLQMDKVEE